MLTDKVLTFLELIQSQLRIPDKCYEFVYEGGEIGLNCNSDCSGECTGDCSGSCEGDCAWGCFDGCTDSGF